MAEPTEGALPVINCRQLLANSLAGAGVIGLDEVNSVEAPVINLAFTLLNNLIAEWTRHRWLAYRLAEYSLVSTGAQTYNVGAGQTVNINPRPDRVEYAFMRFLNSPQPTNLPVDIPLRVIQSREDYSRITVKNIGTLPWAIFYDPVFPVGVLYPWPVPQASQYSIFVGFKVVLARFASLADPVNFPEEYANALYWCLCRRFRASFQLPPDPTTDALARSAVNAIRLANQAVGTLTMPDALRRGGGRSYDYRGDNPNY